MTPRVFSPRGTFAANTAAISFSLARDAAVTVKVCNRAGRVGRTIADGSPLRSGLNIVRWDGRASDARTVPDGLYIVTLEALGETRRQTLAVVR